MIGEILSVLPRWECNACLIPGAGHASLGGGSPVRRLAPRYVSKKNGLNTIPVALVPKHGSLIRMNKVKLLQENLLEASVRYQQITDVRPYGKKIGSCALQQTFYALQTCSNVRRLVRHRLFCSSLLT